jgi:transcriptional regulator with XRE-family HTH domain
LSGRKAQGLTQAALGARAGVGISAVRAVERGQGRLSTLAELLTALGLELRGRFFASGPLGPAMVAARQRRKQSRREVARALGVSRNTLAALEGGVGLVATLEAYGGAIGAGLYLATAGDARTFFTHAGNSSAHHGWQTPVALAELLMGAVGGFDLDPCAASADRRRARVKARLLLTVEDDGLGVPWRGRVFVNPPYGRALKLWVRKCASEASGGAVLSAWCRRGRIRAGGTTISPGMPTCSCCAEGCNLATAANLRRFPRPWWCGARGKSWWDGLPPRS